MTLDERKEDSSKSDSKAESPLNQNSIFKTKPIILVPAPKTGKPQILVNGNSLNLKRIIKM